MNVLQNLVELYNQLPEDSTYKEVARRMLANLDEVAERTIYEVAELTNSSRTTVWRMVQKMGYENYSDFHHALRQAVGNYTYYNRILRPECCADEESIVGAFIQNMKSVRTIMEKNFSEQRISALAEKIHKADKILFFIPYRTFAIAAFQQNLSMTGKITDYVCLYPDMLESCRQLTADSIVFIDTIDHAEAMNVLEIFGRAKKAGAHIIKITKPRAPYDSYTDQVLLNFDMVGDVSTNMNLTVNYFLILSEIYRKKYIGNESREGAVTPT